VVDQAAYDWRVKNLGPNDVATEISTLNLGLDWMGLKRFGDADKNFEDLYQSRRKRLGEAHPDTKDAAKFLALSQSYNPKNISNKQLSGKDIGTLDRLSANTQAGAFDQQGKPKQALPFHRRAFEASVAENGPIDPTTLLMLRNLALSEREVEGKAGHAIQSYEDLSRRTLDWARTEIAATAGNARAEDIRRVANRMIYDVIKLAQENPKAHHLLFQVLMDWKGLGTTEQALLNQLRNQPPDQQVADLVTRLQNLQKSLRQPGQAVDQIQSEIRLNEVKLAQFSTSFFRTRAEADFKPKDIVSKLRPDEVLIDYIIGDRILPDSITIEQEVFAFVTLADGRAIVKDLGKLLDVTAIISKSDYQTGVVQRKKLFDILLKPILKMKSVAKLKSFYIVPDGELFLVPFEGLLNDNNEAFGLQMDVTLMRSAIGMMQTKKQPSKNAAIVLVGAPNYGAEQGDLSFPALPAALKEVIDIQKLAQNSGYTATLITGTAASEAGVRQAVVGQEIVHMATHGFFLPKEFDIALEPPWRGGLALQGANSAIPNGKTNDDGIAYAAELSNWSFDKTDLVVLSACETASGERSYVEGLRGFPAALATSGAKLSLLALWAVPDEGAANFMTNFYGHLLVQGLTYEDAYRATKRDAMAGKIIGAETPDVWQAFVMMRN
jgi:CHAT domain-containing protein